MTARGRWRSHRLTRVLGWTAGVTLVALAVLVALAQLLLPLLAHHPRWVAAQLGARLQRPVAIGALEGRWQGAGPLFVMHDVSIGGRGTPLRLAQAQLQLDFGAWLLPRRRLLNLHVRGMQLDLVHEAQGGWHVEGLGGGTAQQGFSLGPASLDVWLDDLRLGVIDQASGRRYRLVADQVRLNQRGSRIRAGLVLRREGAAGAWRATADFAEDGRSGRAWVQARQVDLHTLFGDIPVAGYTVQGGRGDLSAWLDWADGRLRRATVEPHLAGLVVQGPAATARVAALRGLFRVSADAAGWHLRYRADEGGGLEMLALGSGPQLRLGLGARDLQLAPLLPWLALAPGLPPALGTWIGSGNPHGTVAQATLQWSRAHGLQQLDARLRGAGIDAVGALPGVSNLDTAVRGDGEALALELPAQATVVALPALFRRPFALARLAGTLAAWREGGNWHVGADPLDVEGDGFTASVRGALDFPAAGGRPFAELYAHVGHAEVAAAKLFWPVRAMSPGAMAWLDRALAGGTVEQGDLAIRGNLADWPFRHHEGRFEAQATVHDAILDYGEAWPRAEGISAQASFEDNGMLVQADAGGALGVGLEHAVALIPDFGEGLLDINVQGGGSSASLLKFVRESPIAREQAATLGGIRLGGNGTFDFHLALPLGDPAAMRLDGSAQLQGVDVDAPKWQLALGRLAGPVAFDAHGVHAGPLAGTFHGQPSTLDLRIGAATGRPATTLEARLAGRYTLGELLDGHPQLDWLAAAGQGRADVALGLVIAQSDDGTVHQTLAVDSDLRGIALDLPVPLAKPAAAELPTHAEIGLPLEGNDMTVSVGTVLHGRFRLPDGERQALAGTIALGDGMPAQLPAAGLRIRGHAARMDVSGWVQHAVAGSAGDGPGLESIDASADHALVFDHDFPGMHLKATPGPQVLAIDVDSAGMAGQVSVPTVDLDKRGITAHLQRLYWPATTPQPAPAAATAGVKEDRATSSRAPASAPVAPAPAPTPAEAAATGIDPASLPPLHVFAADLRVGTTRLGEARLETWPTARGMHIDQLRALSKGVQISAGGDWDGTVQASHTHMRMDFAAGNLGALLAAFGYQGLFEGGTTRAKLDAGWPGAPSSLTLANLDGTLHIDVSHGRIPEVAAGVGRLFGLVSMAELPRRLTLDFGDVFGKGLAFDSITGTFHFADGNATTDDLKMHGPAADISIAGRTGLRARDYDQQVRVVPHVGNSLPVVGAVVGGPVGAAAGLAVQGLLGKGLNRAASARYKVTGSWDKPVFTLVEKHAAPAPAASAAPPPGASVPAAPATGVPAPAASVARPAPSASTGG